MRTMKSKWFWLKIWQLNKNYSIVSFNCFFAGCHVNSIQQIIWCFNPDITFFCWKVEFCCFLQYSQISLICLIYFSLPDLYFYTISFIPFTMFLKDLNKGNFRVLLTQAWIISHYRLTPLSKTLGVISY